jgi:hypothetical protein
MPSKNARQQNGKVEPAPPRTGGAFALHGFAYQLLGSIHWASQVAIRERRLSGAKLQSLTLTLEPADGGDARHEAVAVQFKTRSSGKWTDASVVREVLPDLFKATDGKRAENFLFQSDAETRLSEAFGKLGALLSANSVEKALRLARLAKLTFPAGGRPARSAKDFFNWAGAITAKTTQQAFAANQEQRRRFAALLANLKCEQISDREMSKAIEAQLRKVLAHPEESTAARRHLLGYILEMAAKGAVTLKVTEVFAACGISYDAIRAVGDFESNLGQAFDVQMRSLGYSKPDDSRAEPVARIGKKPVALCGVSGVGKSWALARAGSDAMAMGALCLWIEQPAGRDATRREVTDRIQAARGQSAVSNPHNLRSILNAIQVGKPYRVCVFLDRFVSPEQAIDILSDPWWAEHAIEVIGAMPATAPDAVNLPDGIIHRVDVREFSLFELRQFMRDRDVDWTGLPTDVRRLLRRPSLAKIYADRPAAWTNYQPSTEYELIDTVWSRIPTGHHALWQTTMHAVEQRLGSMLDQLLAGEAATYPWTLADPVAPLSTEQVGLLERNGMMRWNADGRVQLDHDRLLAWGLAKAISGRVRNRPEQRSAISALLPRCWNSQAELGGLSRHAVGYVPLDALWQLLAPPSPFSDAMPLILPTITAHPPLGWKDLATMGERGFFLLLQAAESLTTFQIPRELGEALAQTAPTKLLPEQVARIVGLLVSAHAQQRLVALAFLSKRPLSKKLKWLIEQHAVLRDSIGTLSTHAERQAYDEMEAAFKAANSAARRFPKQLVILAKRGLSAREWRTTGWLIVELPPAEAATVWQAARQHLPTPSQPQPVDLPEQLALLHPNRTAVRRLQETAGSDGFALDALSAIAPQQALRLLREPERVHMPHVDVHLDLLFRVCPAAAGLLISRAAAMPDAELGHLRIEMAPPKYRRRYWIEVLGRLSQCSDPGDSRLIDTIARSIDVELLSLLSSAQGRALDVGFGRLARTRLNARIGRHGDMKLDAAETVLLRIGSASADRLIIARLSHDNEIEQRKGVIDALITDDVGVRRALARYCRRIFSAGPEGRVSRTPFDVLVAIDPMRAKALARRGVRSGRADALWLAGEIALTTKDKALGLFVLKRLRGRRPANLQLEINLQFRFTGDRDRQYALATQALRLNSSHGRSLAAWVGRKLGDTQLLRRVENALVKNTQASIDSRDAYTLAQLSEDRQSGPRLLARIKRAPSLRLLRGMLADGEIFSSWMTDPQMTDQAIDSAFQFENSFLNTPIDGQRLLWKVDNELAFESFEEGLRRGGRASQGLAAIAVKADASRALEIIFGRLPDVTDEKTRADLGRALRSIKNTGFVIRRIVRELRSEDESKRLGAIFAASWLASARLDKALIDIRRRDTRSSARRNLQEATTRSDAIRALGSLFASIKDERSKRRRRMLLAVLAANDTNRIIRNSEDPLYVGNLASNEREWTIVENFLKN